MAKKKNTKFVEMHENILNFIEENIAKLVKLKLMNRSNLKEYDDVYKKYLVAESIDSEVRMEQYCELCENCRLALRDKLLSAIRSDVSIVKNPLVIEYGMRLNDWNDDDIKYTDLFDSDDEVDNYKLVDVILYLSHDVDEDTEDKMEKMSHKKLMEMLHHRFYDCTEEWIDDLTYNDLTILRDLCDSEDGRTEANCLVLETLAEMIHLVDTSDDEFILYPDIRNTIEPFLNKAIEKKQKNGEPFLEQLFLGLINICGILSDDAMSILMKTFVRDSHKKLTDKDVDKFLRHTMLVRYYRMAYVCSPGNLMSRIVSPGWESEVRKEYDMYIPKSLDEVLSRGSYPYFQPYRKEEKAFYDLLRKSMDKEDSDGFYTYYYCQLQNPECDYRQFTNELSKDLEPKDITEIAQLMEVYMQFNNNIPKIFLKGNASCDKPNQK